MGVFLFVCFITYLVLQLVMLKSIKSNYLPARPYNRHTSVVDLSTDFSAGNILRNNHFEGSCLVVISLSLTGVVKLKEEK